MHNSKEHAEQMAILVSTPFIFHLTLFDSATSDLMGSFSNADQCSIPWLDCISGTALTLTLPLEPLFVLQRGKYEVFILFSPQHLCYVKLIANETV